MRINIIKNNQKSIFTHKIIFLIILNFILLFAFQLNLTNQFNPTNLYEYIKYCFWGNNSIFENISSLFAWSMCQLLFLLIMINYLTTEFDGRNIYIISRVGNKKNWFLNIELSIILSSIIYFLIGFLTITICSIIVNKNILITPDFINILFMLIVLFLNSFFYINLYLLISLKSNHSNSSILLIIILIFLFMDLGGKFHFDSYNPFVQCIMSKHYMNNISFPKSIILLLISNSLVYFYLRCQIIKKDLINITICKGDK